MSKITLMNNDLRIFQGLYESTLYNSDTDYYLAHTLADDNLDGIDLKNTEVDYDFQEFKQVAGKACVNSLEDELYSHDVITNMDYVGLTNNPKRRKNRHFNDLENHIHDNPYL